MGAHRVLRRRRREGGDQPVSDRNADSDVLAADAAEQAGGITSRERDLGDDDDGGPSPGPWDIAADFPPGERIDCGSLLIPVREGFDIQINVAEEQGVWVAVVHGESGMQLQAFAAPRSGGLWDEVRHEIADNIAESGGSCRTEHGPFGVELHAQVPIGEEGQSSPQLQPVRFLGHDGPRWFLRGVISGPAASHPDQGTAFDAVFADIVVVRGDYPAPPRDQLEIRLPEEARQALDAQLAETDEGWDLPNPFERGPEITETR